FTKRESSEIFWRDRRVFRDGSPGGFTGCRNARATGVVVADQRAAANKVIRPAPARWQRPGTGPLRFRGLGATACPALSHTRRYLMPGASSYRVLPHTGCFLVPSIARSMSKLV